MALTGSSNMFGILWKEQGSLQLDASIRRKTVSITEAKKALFGLGDSLDFTNRHYVKSGERIDFLRQRVTGLRSDISLLRNNILLLVFSLGAASRELYSSVEAATKYQIALAGVRSVALATGNDVSGVKDAVIELTQDGLISMAGAAQGVKNLLATGLNLKQSVDLMKVFKDAASFNRQGMLDFEEAIIRATAGVKMQQAKLIDDVGIRTRVGQMLELQGFQLEDLTNETTKAGAVQALYNGLMKEGRFFVGDAARMTETYAGAQQRLEAQLFKTKAAAGDTLIGDGGTLEDVTSSFTRYLSYYETYLKLNKELVSLRMNEYFKEFLDIITGIAGILKVALAPVLGLVTALMDSGLLKIGIWIALIGKLGGKILKMQGDLLSFGGSNIKTSEIFNTLQLTRYGDKLGEIKDKFKSIREDVKYAYGALPKVATSEYVGDKLNSKDIKIKAQLDAMARGESNMPKGFQKGQMERWSLFLNRKEEFEKLKFNLENINLKNVDETIKKIDALGKVVPGTKVAFASLRKDLVETSAYLKNIEKAGGGFATTMKGMFITAGLAVKNFALTLKSVMVEMLPLLAIQAIIAGGVAIFNHYENLRRKQEESKQVQLDYAKSIIQTDKDLFDSKIAAISQAGMLLSEYKQIGEKVDKQATDYARLKNIQDELNVTSNKYHLGLSTELGLHNNLSTSINAQTLALKELNKAKYDSERANLEYAKSLETRKLGNLAINNEGDLGDIGKLFKGRLSPFKDIFGKMFDYRTETVSTGEGSMDIQKYGINRNAEVVGSAMSELIDKLELMLKFNSDVITNKIKDLKDVADSKGLTGAKRDAFLTSGKTGVYKNYEDIDAITNVLNELKALGFTTSKFDQQISLLDKAFSEAFKDGKTIRSAGMNFEKFLNMIEGTANKAESYGKIGIRFDAIDQEIKGYQIRLRQEGNKLQGGASNPLYQRAQMGIARIEASAYKKAIESETMSLDKEKESMLIKIREFNISKEQVQILEAERKGKEEVYKLDLMRVQLVNELADPSRKLNDAQRFALTDAIQQTEQLINLQKDYTTNVKNQIIMEEHRRRRSASMSEENSYDQSMFSIYKEKAGLTSSDITGRRNAVEFEAQEKAANNLFQRRQLESDQIWAVVGSEEMKLIQDKLKHLISIGNAEADIYKIKLKQLEIDIQLRREELLRNKKIYEFRNGLGGAFASIGESSLGMPSGSIESLMKSYAEKQDVLGEMQSKKNKGILLTKDDIAEYDSKLAAIDDKTNQTIQSMAEGFGNLAYSIADIYDFWGLKASETALSIRANQEVDQKLLMEDFKMRKMTLQEYAAQREYLSAKAGIEEVKAARLASAAQQTAIGEVLQSLSKEFAVRAIGAAASLNFGQAAAYSAAALIAGGAGVSYMKAGQSARITAEADARLADGMASRRAERLSGNSSGVTDAGGRSISGNITAQELRITIAPVITITGETLIMSNTGVQEAAQIMGDFTVNRIQEAIDNKEIVLDAQIGR